MMQSEQIVSAGAQQAARAGCIDMLLGETRTEAGVGTVMSVTAAAILWAPDTQAMLLAWLGWMAVLYGVRLGLCWGHQRSPSRKARVTAWSVLFTLGVAGTFLTWGLLGIALYGRATPYQQGFVLLLTACMVLATLSIYRGATAARPTPRRRRCRAGPAPRARRGARTARRSGETSRPSRRTRAAAPTARDCPARRRPPQTCATRGRARHRARRVGLDADDELEADAVRSLAAAARTHPDAELVYSDYEFIDADGTAFKRVDNPDPADPVELLLRLHDRLGEPDNFVPFGHARLYRSKALRLHGGFNNSFRYAEDFELLLRLAARGCQFAHVPQRLYRYRWHGGKGIVNRPAQIDEVKRAVRELVGERR